MARDISALGRSTGVIIRGTRDGVSIVCEQGDWDDLLEDLAKRLHATAAFFTGSRVTLDVGERLVSEGELRALEEIINRYDMGLYAVVAANPRTRDVARAVGTRAMSGEQPESRPAPAAPAAVEAPAPEQGPSQGILVRRTVRSGQAVQHPGHVVIIGDVNPGGEVIAGGDVVIWGKLRGVVHAGAVGDDGAVVCALQMRPMQLRIGNHIARAPEERGKRPSRPEVALVKGDSIVAEPWDESSSA